MQFKLTGEDFGNALDLQLANGEQFIVERGALLLAEGEYQLKSKVEAKSSRQWIMSALGKSLVYNLYTAVEECRLLLAPNGVSQLVFSLDFDPGEACFIHPQAHFGRAPGLELKLSQVTFKNVVHSSPLIEVTGTAGVLFLQSRGKPFQRELTEGRTLYVDEDALLALTGAIRVEPVPKGGLKETLTSGEGYLLRLTGSGTVYLQPRTEGSASSGGSVGGWFGWFT